MSTGGTSCGQPPRVGALSIYTGARSTHFSTASAFFLSHTHPAHHQPVLPGCTLHSAAEQFRQRGRAAFPMQSVSHLTVQRGGGRATWTKTNENIFPELGEEAQT